RDGDISRIGQKLSAAGGGYFNNETPNRPSGVVSGVDGGWSYPVDNLGGDYGTPQPGHIAASGQFTINGGLADFLYRNDIGVHEGNTMHTNIDMTGNRLDSTGEINGRNPSTGTNSNVAVGSQLIGHNWTDPSDTKVYVANSLGVCAQQPDLEGCGVTVSPGAGGFYKNGDWLAFNGSVSGAGLHVTGPGNNFQVDGGSRLVGEITAETGLNLINGSPITWSDRAPGLVVTGDSVVRNGSQTSQLHIKGAPLAVDAMSYLDGNATTRYVLDTDNSNYYLHPSGESILESAKFTGNVGVRNMDPNAYPGTLQGGLHGYDFVSSGGTFAAGNSPSSINIAMNGPGGSLEAAAYVQGQVLRPTLTAVAGAPCNESDGMISPNPLNYYSASNDAARFTANNGDIAKDKYGNTLTCVTGMWVSSTAFSLLYYHQCESNNFSYSDFPHQNNTGRPWLIEYAGGESSSHKNNLEIYVNGQLVTRNSNSANDGSIVYSSTFILLPGDSFTEVMWRDHDQGACMTIYM
ncbi:shufflon system plasmid conjugative transfer pilus tip adhesin PilV, partial [Acetobacter pomorum]